MRHWGGASLTRRGVRYCCNLLKDSGAEWRFKLYYYQGFAFPRELIGIVWYHSYGAGCLFTAVAGLQ